MQRRTHFGRRTAPEPARRYAPSRVAPVSPEAAAGARPDLMAAASVDDGIDLEIREWNKARKQRRRALREPWRSVSIVTGIGFGLSSWLLPDSVASIADLVTGGLTIAAFAAALRTPPSEKIQPSEDPRLP